MTQRPSGLKVAAVEVAPAVVKDLAILAVVAAAALVVALAVRPIASYDIGYHLAYGEYFLQHGRIVQTNRFTYARLEEDLPADPGSLAPGGRFDAATNTYHFINANWLSQVVFAAVHLAGGMIALSILRAALVAGIFVLLIVTMRRSSAATDAPPDAGRRGGVGWHWIAPAVVLIALSSYERFDLRPELLGYLVLLGQWALLVRPRAGRRGLCAMIALQVLAVNFHSYFLLGVALSAAMLADAFAHWLWARTVTGRDDAAAKARMKWLAIATGGMVLACLCNPWHLRGAIFPIQTVAFLSRHQIVGGTPTSLTAHPWALIGEFPRTLAEQFSGHRATTAYIVVLALAAAGGLVAAARRRWGWLLVMVGAAWVSLTTRRNIALGAFLMVPLALVSLTDGWRWLAGRVRRPTPAVLARIGPAAVAVISAAAALWWTVSIVSNEFYASERRSWRFGLGVSRVMIPVEAAEWINRHAPAGNVWCDFANSSNLMYLTRPHRDVPILTNTFAYPPRVLRQSIFAAAGLEKWAPVARKHRVGTVVLRFTAVLPTDLPTLMKQLSRDPGWVVVQLGVRHVVFLRADGANAALADRAGIAEEDFDVGGHVDACRRADPVEAEALYDAGRLLAHLEWYGRAITVWKECLKLDPDHARARRWLRWVVAVAPGRLAARGRTLAKRGTELLQRMRRHLQRQEADEAAAARRAALADWQEARRLLEGALEIDPDHLQAADALQLLRRQMEAFQRGVILLPSRS